MAIADFDYVWPQGEQHPAVAEWLQDVQPLIAGLALRLPPEVVLDYSRQSLVELNEWVLARFPDKASVREDDEAAQDLRVRITAYVGETLLSVGGGRWHYQDAPGVLFHQQMILFQDNGSEVPTSPLSLLTAAVARRQRDMFAKVYDFAVQQLERRRLTEPGWRPVREPTPGLTVVPEPVTPEHEAWLAAMDSELASFIAALPPGSWDLSPPSLDPLGAALLARPVEGDGPARYVGEVMRRTYGGRWETRAQPHVPEGKRQVVVDGWVQRGTGRPASAVMDLLTARDPGRLEFHLHAYGLGVARARGDERRWAVPES